MQALIKPLNNLESGAKVMTDEVAATPVGEAGRVFYFFKKKAYFQTARICPAFGNSHLAELKPDFQLL